MIGRKIETPLDFKLQQNMKFKNKALRVKYKGYIKNMMRINKEIADEESKLYHEKREKAGDKGRKEPKFTLKQIVFYWMCSYPPFGSEKSKIH